MDYNFNLKHTSQRKFRMSPLLQPSGFERCYSTSSSLSANKCKSEELNVKPFLHFLTGLHKQKTNHYKLNTSGVTSSPLPSGTFTSKSVTTMPCGPFNSTRMSVSCYVGGFVGGSSRIQQAPQLCDKLIWDVIDKLTPFGNTVKRDTNVEPPYKRTYAEVTREKPKSQAPMNFTQMSATPLTCLTADSVKNNSSNCDISLLRRSNSIVEVSHNFKLWPEKMISITKSNSEMIVSPRIPRQKSCSSSSESASETGKQVDRTLSECSVESDDSFIIFQNDEGTVCDFSDEDASDDDDDDEENEVFPVLLPGNETSPPHHESCSKPVQKKMVRWKDDRDLVKIHHLVTWDYASRAARVGPWEQYGRDRDRFEKRIKQISEIVSPILNPTHRQAIFSARFSVT